MIFGNESRKMDLLVFLLYLIQPIDTQMEKPQNIMLMSMILTGNFKSVYVRRNGD